jgi:4-alpha-glucanotransferase
MERLRKLRGIGRSFTDYRGEVRYLPEHALRRLLEALGETPADEAGLARAADKLETREWTRVLAPVAILRGGRNHIPVSLAVPLAAALHWRIETEQGDTLSGRIATTGLPILAEREIGAQRYLRLELELPALALGYHRFSLEHPDGTALATTRLIAAPEKCYEPDEIRGGERMWGAAIQLYSLRSSRNWGIGDFTDLAEFAEALASLGADLIGLNPLHALFPAEPGRCGPYSPSSRYFLNTLYIDPEQVPEFAACEAAQQLVAAPAFQARLARLREAPRVDYPGVTACKLDVLRLLYAEFRLHGAPGHKNDFMHYVKKNGQRLEEYCLFHALHAHIVATGGSGGWPAWPERYHHPEGAAAKAFLAVEGAAVEFHAWLHWIAAAQLKAAEQRARAAGLRVGFYRDLAVGPDNGGAETWAEPELFAHGATVGAPPDELALQGQDWGIPPFHPEALREHAYEPFVALLRANMGQDAALRIDHVMMLFRLWWVPHGSASADGGYVHYPLDDLMAIVALESQRRRCVVIGEDLGTVPPEVRDAMAAHGLYSYRVLFFEREADGRFRRPGDYPRQALATISTHDLPPLASFWTGSDIDLRERLGLYANPEQARAARAERAATRTALLAALAEEGLLPAGAAAQDVMTAPLAHAVQCYLARAAAALLVLQPEDWLGMEAPVNVPGTHESYPNWSRKLSAEWRDFVAGPELRALAREMQAVRGSGSRLKHKDGTAT